MALGELLDAVQVGIPGDTQPESGKGRGVSGNGMKCE